MTKIDVGIIGCGPSGITAAIYLKRAGVNFVLFESYMVGGKANVTSHIDNYPPYTKILGSDLAQQYQEDLDHNQIDINYEEVLSLKKVDDYFEVITDVDTYAFKTILVCSGTKDKTLNFENEEKYLTNGISFCAVCDGNLFKNQPVAVVGGGNSALEEALYLSSIASKVYVIHRRNEFRGNKQYFDLLVKKDNIELITPYNIIKAEGDHKLRKLHLVSSDTNKEKIIDVEALFEYVGAIPNTSFILDKQILDDKGFIKVNQNMETDIKGLFASGDVTNRPLRQVIIASGDGALATNGILSYLRKDN